MEDVIVVGAGPAGLWLAAELRRAGVPVLVLERAEAPSPHSKALTLHPRMIEVLAMRGMARDFLDEGVMLPSGHFGLLESRLDFRPLPTRHPYTLFFPQRRTEELLERARTSYGPSGPAAPYARPRASASPAPTPPCTASSGT
jgi:2-polyprenyl-6-methoxyphenol hydroxylase-like FAD-dependent oxidoreductase